MEAPYNNRQWRIYYKFLFFSLFHRFSDSSSSSKILLETWLLLGRTWILVSRATYYGFSFMKLAIDLFEIKVFARRGEESAIRFIKPRKSISVHSDVIDIRAKSTRLWYGSILVFFVFEMIRFGFSVFRGNIRRILPPFRDFFEIPIPDFWIIQIRSLDTDLDSALSIQIWVITGCERSRYAEQSPLPLHFRLVSKLFGIEIRM